MNFAMTKRGEVYHIPRPPVESDDPLMALVVDVTRCNRRITRIVDETTSPSPLSADTTVLEAVLRGLVCGNCR